jgi:hypothetical protein
MTNSPTKTQHELFFGKPISDKDHFAPPMNVQPTKLRRSKRISTTHFCGETYRTIIKIDGDGNFGIPFA